MERQLPLHSVLSVGYVAHRGLDGWQVYDINQPTAGALQANPGVNVNALRPYKGFAAIQEEESAVRSMYNSLQVSWNRRFYNGFMFGFSYTYSKSMDNGSNYRDIVPDTYNTSNLYGPSEYDERHVAIINYTYDLPFFKASKGFVKQAFAGWEISGAMQFQTGTPCGIWHATTTTRASAKCGSFGCGSEGQFWNLTGPITINTGAFAGPVTNSSSPQLLHGQRDAAGDGHLQPAGRGARFRLSARIAGLECGAAQGVRLQRAEQVPSSAPRPTTSSTTRT